MRGQTFRRCKYRGPYYYIMLKDSLCENRRFIFIFNIITLAKWWVLFLIRIWFVTKTQSVRDTLGIAAIVIIVMMYRYIIVTAIFSIKSSFSLFDDYPKMNRDTDSIWHPNVYGIFSSNSTIFIRRVTTLPDFMYYRSANPYQKMHN